MDEEGILLINADQINNSKIYEPEVFKVLITTYRPSKTLTQKKLFLGSLKKEKKISINLSLTITH